MRLAEDLITARIRAALGSAYDPKATYRVVRPAMIGLPKFAGDEVVGEFVEDGRDGGKLVVLRRKVIPPKPPVVPVSAQQAAAQSAADRVRGMLGKSRKP